jgi:hypothetical protein
MLFGDIPQGEILLNHFMSSIYMSPMSDDAMLSQLLSPHHLCQSTPFLAAVDKKFSTLPSNLWDNLMLFGDIPQGEMLLNHFMSSIYESNE